MALDNSISETEQKAGTMIECTGEVCQQINIKVGTKQLVRRSDYDDSESAIFTILCRGKVTITEMLTEDGYDYLEWKGSRAQGTDIGPELLTRKTWLLCA